MKATDISGGPDESPLEITKAVLLRISADSSVAIERRLKAAEELVGIEVVEVAEVLHGIAVDPTIPIRLRGQAIPGLITFRRLDNLTSVANAPRDPQLLRWRVRRQIAAACSEVVLWGRYPAADRRFALYARRELERNHPSRRATTDRCVLFALRLLVVGSACGTVAAAMAVLVRWFAAEHTWIVAPRAAPIAIVASGLAWTYNTLGIAYRADRRSSPRSLLGTLVRGLGVRRYEDRFGWLARWLGWPLGMVGLWAASTGLGSVLAVSGVPTWLAFYLPFGLTIALGQLVTDRTTRRPR